MKIAILTGIDSAANVACLERLLTVPGVELAAILYDTGTAPWRRRVRNLRRNIAAEGVSYAFWRVIQTLNAKLDRMAQCCASAPQAEAWMRQAFPGESFSLEEFARRRGVAFHEAGNLNDAAAAALLASTGAELGVVLGTRVLKRSTFAVPPRGCINLHKGRVPDYRGLPPGFWEIYDGCREAGVTVHFVDDGLDTGHVLEARSIPIRPTATPDTLRHELDKLGTEALAAALEALARGTEQPRPQSAGGPPPRRRPTRRQQRELAARYPHLPYARENPLYTLSKSILYQWPLRWLAAVLRRARRSSRAVILLYHRVDDAAPNPLSISRQRFAEHLSVLKTYYSVRSTAWLVDRLAAREPIPPGTVVVHFDDCYETVASAAAPLLEAAGLPGTSFVNSGFVGTDRRFAHDERRYALTYANMSAAQVRRLPGYGVSVAAHTVNHTDMGVVTPDEAAFELTECRHALENLVQAPVDLFSFPYGRPENVQPTVLSLARQTGYRAVFSAHGGYVGPGTDLFDIPRVGVSGSLRPLDLMLEIEGLTISALRRSRKKR